MKDLREGKQRNNGGNYTIWSFIICTLHQILSEW